MRRAHQSQCFYCFPKRARPSQITRSVSRQTCGDIVCWTPHAMTATVHLHGHKSGVRACVLAVSARAHSVLSVSARFAVCKILRANSAIKCGRMLCLCSFVHVCVCVCVYATNHHTHATTHTHAKRRPPGGLRCTRPDAIINTELAFMFCVCV